MARKKEINFRQDEDLAEIDAALDEALSELESANSRVGDLLYSIEHGDEEGEGPEEASREGEAARPSEEASSSDAASVDSPDAKPEAEQGDSQTSP